MEVKLLEIRDALTFIPAMAIKPTSRTEEERYLMSRAGYGRTTNDHNSYVLLARISGGTGQISYDPYEWGGSRTFPVAHKHIIENWDSLKSGDVICVETILGERETPKTSERLGLDF